MEALIVIGTGAIVFLALSMTIPRLVPDKAEKRTKTIIDQIATGSESRDDYSVDADTAASHFKQEATGITKFLLGLPGAPEFYALMLKAGYAKRVKSVVMVMIGLFLAFTIIFAIPLGVFALIPALFLSYLVPKKWFHRQLKKRNRQFIEMFPEAIDMIVRSVKSGHPLNTALRMIADNMEDPIASEFRQVVNEIAYGRPVVEALRRMSQRIDEQDVNFFVVVLAVQQETGGNLAEILSNLSNIIRGRKRLMQKIMAMTSEGRATLFVLGGLPVIVFAAINFTSPKYMLPLYETLMGNVILGAALSLIAIAVVSINKMIDIDI